MIFWREDMKLVLPTVLNFVRFHLQEDLQQVKWYEYCTPIMSHLAFGDVGSSYFDLMFQLFPHVHPAPMTQGNGKGDSCACTWWTILRSSSDRQLYSWEEHTLWSMKSMHIHTCRHRKMSVHRTVVVRLVKESRAYRTSISTITCVFRHPQPPSRPASSPFWILEPNDRLENTFDDDHV